MTQTELIDERFEIYNLDGAVKIGESTNAEADVYRIDGKVARIRKLNKGKIGDRETSSLELALNELSIMKELFDNDIKVPKPYGVYQFYSTKLNGTKVGVLMEYIPGIRVDDNQIHYLDFGRACNKMLKEITKSMRLGFMPKDTGQHNTLWIPDKQDICLIDVGKWGEDNMDLYYQRGY